MTRKTKRRSWGTILAKYDSEGQITGWIARYVSPLNSKKKISRHFKLEYKTQAEDWLDQEHYLVILHHKKIKKWESPADRNKEKAYKDILFEDYLDNYIKKYRKKDGSKITGSSMRNLLADCAHFLPSFRGKRMREITSKDIGKWYKSDHPEGPWSFYGSCQVLRSIFRHAATSFDGAEPLIADNPFVFPITVPKDSERVHQRPISPDEARRIADAMPDYTRLSVWLALLVGGLRIGEACALRVDDIDMDHKILYVRHSVDRGDHDRGPCRLGPTKTKSSVRVVPIPDCLIGPIEAHIRRYCTGKKGMLFPAKRSQGHILSPTTLGQQFRKARLVAGRDDITFHSLRATHATMMMLKGGTLRESMEELGHTSEKIAIRHYQRIVPTHRKSVVNKLALDYLPGGTDVELLRLQIRDAEREMAQLQKKLNDLYMQMEQIKTVD